MNSVNRSVCAYCTTKQGKPLRIAKDDCCRRCGWGF